MNVEFRGRTFTVGVNGPGMSDRMRLKFARALRSTPYHVVGDSSFTRVQVWVDPFAEFPLNG